MKAADLRQRATPVLLLIMLGGGALRFYNLAAKHLWVDEIFTALFAAPDNSWLEVAQRPLATPLPTPPLWFWITHLFLRLFGQSDLVLRLPALLLGIGGIGVIYLVAKQLFADGRVALVAAALLATSPIHIHYSREARFYPAIVFLSLLTILCLYRGTERGGPGWQWGWWLGFAAASLANIYVHLTALLVLAAELLFAGLLLAVRHAGESQPAGFWRRLKGERSFALPLAVAAVLIGAGYLPMVPYLLEGAQGARGLGAAGETRGFTLSLHYFFELLATFGAGGGFAFTLFVATAVWGVVQARGRHPRALALLLAVAVIPFLLVALTRPRHWFAFKYVITLLPIYLLWVALGIVELADTLLAVRRGAPSPVLQRGLLLLLLLPYLFLAWPRYRDDVVTVRPSRWYNIAQLFQENGHPEDVVAVLDVWERILPAPRLLSYYGPTPEDVTLVAVTRPRQLETLLAAHGRLWLVADLAAELEAGGPFLNWLERHGAVPLAMENLAVVYLVDAHTERRDLLAEVAAMSLPAAAHRSLAWAYVREGLPAESEAVYRQGLQPDVNDASLYLAWGRLYLQQGNREAAAAVYAEILALSPDSATQAEYHATAATAYAEAGYPGEAAVHYRQAIALHGPGNGDRLQAWQAALQQLPDAD